MKNHLGILIIVALILVGLIEVMVYNSVINTRNPQPPVAEEGFVDLSNWDFDKHGVVKLDGQWEFYWMQLLDPQDILSAGDVGQKEFMRLPCLWNSYRLKNEKKPPFGYATFYLKLKMPLGSFSALKIMDINTSYRLWINGRLEATNGVVGKGPEDARPQYLPQVVLFRPESETVQIVLQVSNFTYSLGGVPKSILIGNSTQIIKIRENQKAFEFFLIGTLMIMCLYHFGLFFLNRKEYSLLYFGFFCLLILIRTLLTGERFMVELFPNLNWALALKIEIIPVFWAPWVFLAFLRSLFPKEVDDRLFYIVLFLEMPAGLIFLFIPPLFFEAPVITFQMVLIFVSAYCFYVLIKALLKKRSGAGFLVTGYVILFFTVINDVLYSQFLIRTNYIIPFGLLIFILFAFALQKKMVRAQEVVLKQQKKLKQAEKMAALGTLVSCVAHDINNPNNSVKMTSQTLAETWKNVMPVIDEYVVENGDFQLSGRMYSEYREAILHDFSRITRNAERIQYIVNNLKTFGKKDDDALLQKIDINSIIETASDLFYNENKANSRVTTLLGHNIPKIRGSYWDLVQVIVNLLQNACQAQIGLRDDVLVRTRFDKETQKVSITIKDRGVGIALEDLKKIKEQFYTTKIASGGMGLGLFISSGIVKHHGGELEIDSSPGEGTTVRIFLNSI